MGSSSPLELFYPSFDQDPLGYLSTSVHGRATIPRLIERFKNMFISDAKEHSIPVRSISANGAVDKINLLSDNEVRDFLGDVPTQTLRNTASTTGTFNYQKDEKCRFIHLCTPSTVGPLKLHPRMLLRLMTFYQVMSQVLDFLYVYSSQHAEDRELRFSGFRTEKALANPDSSTIVPELGRSGRRYQLCLNLKTVAPKPDGNWKIRQAIIYHQFDVGQGTQLWLIGDPHGILKKRVGELYHDSKLYPTSFSTVSQGFMSSLEVHLDFAEWAASEWRWHLLFLEDRAEELTKPARIRERSHLETIKPASLTDVQKWEEKTNDTIMAMESNVNIMRLLQRFYRDLLKDENFPAKERILCQQATKTFSFRLEELVCETQMQIMRAKALAKLVADRKTIIIQHLQTQSAIVSSKLAASMFKQADRSAMEAIAVRIVTIVTMIYLPATFSSTFFSTDVVKYQEGEVFSKLALMRFVEVTLPLMILTFVPAGVWFWMELRKRTQKSHKIKRSMSELFPPDAAEVRQTSPDPFPPNSANLLVKNGSRWQTRNGH
ncbi:hypothetical protein CCHR01_11735 [Colletotrichum chrysophilum]|uniref:CorA-like transporter domain-containing protein n=1 Tax=Colletotrichum chrysophilum TaxID=1836956 RepID=A0AAD9ACH0_9PEZI|nr:hypothetical protein CCHR01_11735 [Colletotrichum chrysophilum]